MDTDNNSKSLCSTAAFSSKHSTDGDSCVLKLAKLVQHPPPAITSSQTTHFPVCLGRNKAEDGEISVFGAERYFNMKLENDSLRTIIDSQANKHGLKKYNRNDLHYRRPKPKSRPGTPSISSDASWNSQTTLLQSALRKPSQYMDKKVNEKMHFSGFICSWPCSDKKSIDIHKNNIEHEVKQGKEFRKKAIQFDLNPVILDRRSNRFQPRFQAKDELHCTSFERSERENNVSLPISSCRVQNLRAKSQLEVEKIIREEPRMSLEVFGSHMIQKDDIAMNLERKLSMLTWDAIPKVQDFTTSSVTGGVHEDLGSDSSSDLFEIENLSSTEKPLFTRQASDGMSSCMTSTTKYEPSEASIEWSVVTASAADFPVVNTGYDEKKLEVNTKLSGVAKTKSIVDKDVQTSRPSGLLSCKSHKALNVVETAYRTNERQNLSQYSIKGWIPLCQLGSYSMRLR
nr:LOW QUALITY PROTEIN: protein PHYTOCHROME KINASE SUBSTRATE 3-like [Quercus suber]